MRGLNPPGLPPHLLQVVFGLNLRLDQNGEDHQGLIFSKYKVMLNRDVSYQPDPTLLEEPSHVMLNHFYAQVLPTQLLCLLVSKENDSPATLKKKYSPGVED